MGVEAVEMTPEEDERWARWCQASAAARTNPTRMNAELNRAAWQAMADNEDPMWAHVLRFTRKKAGNV
jgi:hypothetical protein